MHFVHLPGDLYLKKIGQQAQVLEDYITWGRSALHRERDSCEQEVWGSGQC
jgi:hypothetical protein